jgi:hypothetical protein
VQILVDATFATMARGEHTERERQSAIGAVAGQLFEFAGCIPLIRERFAKAHVYGDEWHLMDAVFAAQLLRLRMLTEFLIGRPHRHKRWDKRDVHAIDFVEPWPPDALNDDIGLLASRLDDLASRTCHLTWRGAGGGEHFGDDELIAIARLMRAFHDVLAKVDPERASQMRENVEQLERWLPELGR